MFILFRCRQASHVQFLTCFEFWKPINGHTLILRLSLCVAFTCFNVFFCFFASSFYLIWLKEQNIKTKEIKKVVSMCVLFDHQNWEKLNQELVATLLNNSRPSIDAIRNSCPNDSVLFLYPFSQFLFEKRAIYIGAIVGAHIQKFKSDYHVICANDHFNTEY